jgi:hypothetical protein
MAKKKGDAGQQRRASRGRPRRPRKIGRPMTRLPSKRCSTARPRPLTKRGMPLSKTATRLSKNPIRLMTRRPSPRAGPAARRATPAHRAAGAHQRGDGISPDGLHLPADRRANGRGALDCLQVVPAGLAAITQETAEELRRVMMEQCHQIIQKLMPLMDETALRDALDGILTVQQQQMKLARMLRGNSLSINVGGKFGRDGSDEDIVLRIKADAPVLKPDEPVPARPVL